MATVQQELQMAQEFTDIERRGLRVWLDVDNAGDEVLAERILQDVLQHEHYTSRLDADVTKRTPEQQIAQQRLAALAAESLLLGAEFLAQKKADTAQAAAEWEASIRAIRDQASG